MFKIAAVQQKVMFKKEVLIRCTATTGLLVKMPIRAQVGPIGVKKVTKVTYLAFES